jgi:hypothetical protein
MTRTDQLNAARQALALAWEPADCVHLLAAMRQHMTGDAEAHILAAEHAIAEGIEADALEAEEDAKPPRRHERAFRELCPVPDFPSIPRFLRDAV